MATRPITESRGLAAALDAQALGALWSRAAFATTIPLDGVRVMPAQAVSGALAFTPGANPQAGASCYVRLTSDGSHAPTFPGFAEHSSSSGWSNNAGAVNLVTFWHDGTVAFYAVTQAVVGPSAGIVSSAVVQAATPTQITVGFSVALDPADVPAPSAFTLANSGGADTVTGVAINGSGQLVLTKSRTTLTSDTITLGYIKPASAPLTDVNGNQIASLTGRSVTNNVASFQYLRMTTLGANMAEQADAGGGYDYVPNANVTNIYAAGSGVSSAKRIPTSTDGWFSVRSGTQILVGLSTSASPASYNDCQFALFTNGSGYSQIGLGDGGNGITRQDGDIIRMRRVGTTIDAEVSQDGGTTWVVAAQKNGATTAALTPYIQATTSGANGTAYQVEASASVA